MLFSASATESILPDRMTAHIIFMATSLPFQETNSASATSLQPHKSLGSNELCSDQKAGAPMTPASMELYFFWPSVVSPDFSVWQHPSILLHSSIIFIIPIIPPI